MIRSIIFLLFAFGSIGPVVAQTILAQWTFDGATAGDIPGSLTSPAVSSGMGTLQLTGGVTAIFGAGAGSSDPVTPATSNFSWQTSGYPASGIGTATAGIVIASSSAGFHNLSLVFDQRLSSTSNNTWIVQYTSDVTIATPVWTTAQVFTFTPASSGTGDTWYLQRSVDLSAVVSLNDNTNLGFRIVSAFDPTSGNYLASASNKTYATTGNSRFDVITISGIPDIIVENSPPAIENLSLTGNLNAGDTLHATYTYSDSEGDAEGNSVYKWIRADDAAGTNADTLTSAADRDYILTNDDLNKFISLKVVPVAQTGTTPGRGVVAVYIGPVLQAIDIVLYPAPFDLSKGNFAFRNWSSASAAGTNPANMVFQQFNTEPSSASTSPTALWACVYNGSSHSRIIGLDAGGVAFLNTSDEQGASDCSNGTSTGGYVGTAVLSLNTTGASNILLAWKASLVVAANGTTPREYHLKPQYRIFGAAGWTDFAPADEFSSATSPVGNIVPFSTPLPAAIENVPVVFIRWIYYQKEVGGSGSRPEISLDDIVVTNPAAPNSAPTASDLSVGGLLLANGTFSASFVYNDAEGDAIGETLYQWYVADDASGSNAVAIANATGPEIESPNTAAGKFIGFIITPVAKSGTLVGAPVESPFVGPLLSLENPSILKINEINSLGDKDPLINADWVEFYNPGTTDVTLAGLEICDSGSCFLFPAVDPDLVVPAKGFLALLQNQPNSFPFGLSSAGEYVVLKNPFTRELIDSINFPAMVLGQSYGRFTDGASRLTVLIPPTFNASNNTAVPQDAITGIKSNETRTAVYPNPWHDILTVESPVDNALELISVITLAGQEIIHLVPAAGIIRLQITDLKPGFYLLSLTHRNGSKEIRKIIKE